MKVIPANAVFVGAGAGYKTLRVLLKWAVAVGDVAVYADVVGSVSDPDSGGLLDPDSIQGL